MPDLHQDSNVHTDEEDQAEAVAAAPVRDPSSTGGPVGRPGPGPALHGPPPL